MAKKQKIDFQSLWYLVFDQKKRIYAAMSYYDFHKNSFPFNLKIVQQGSHEEMQRIASEQNKQTDRK